MASASASAPGSPSPSPVKDLRNIATACRLNAARRQHILVSLKHECTNRCPLQMIPLYEYDNGHVCSPFFSSCENGTHFDTDARRSASIPNRSYMSLAMCCNSGKEHLCGGAFCDQWIDVEEDGTRVCQLTGNVLDTQVHAEGPKFDPRQIWGYVPMMMRKTDPEMLRPGVPTDLGHPLKKWEAPALPVVRRSLSTQSFGKLEFRAQCIRVIRRLLSADRFAKEVETARLSHEKRIREEIRREFQACKRQKRVPCVIKLGSIVFAQRQRMGTATALRAPEDAVNQLAAAYAEAVQILWGILRTKCAPAGGNEVAKRLNFREFVVAVLECMQVGLTVADRERTHEVEVLPHNSLLASVPMTRLAQSFVLTRPRNLATLKKSIKTVMQKAVTEHHVHPETLRVRNYTIEAFPDEVY